MKTLKDYTGMQQDWFNGVLKLFPDQTSESLFLEAQEITGDDFNDNIEGSMFSRMENLVDDFDNEPTTFESLHDFLDYLWDCYGDLTFE